MVENWFGYISGATFRKNLGFLSENFLGLSHWEMVENFAKSGLHCIALIVRVKHEPNLHSARQSAGF